MNKNLVCNWCVHFTGLKSKLKVAKFETKFGNTDLYEML